MSNIIVPARVDGELATALEVPQVFTNEQFGDIRTVFIEDGEIRFVAVDCCRALDIKNNRDAISKLDDDEKGVAIIDTLGGNQKMSVVTEAGLYRLIFMSRKPNAKEFQRWIFHEVIPSIRKRGYYVAPTAESYTITPMLLRQLADQLEAKDREIAAQADVIEMQGAKLATQETQIAEMNPKASYYDVVLNCKDLVSISTIAKDYGMSAIEMNKLLHELGVQYRQGKIWLPYQKYAQLGWTQTKTHTYLGNGETHAKVHTYWTQAGRLGLYELLKCNGYLPLIERYGAARLGVELAADSEE